MRNFQTTLRLCVPVLIGAICVFVVPAFAQSPVENIDANAILDQEEEEVEEYAAPEPEAEYEEADASDLAPLTTSVFVDGFCMKDWNAPSNPAAAGDLPHRAYDFANGMALAFAGIDVRYQKDEVGLTLDLRYGEGTSRYLGNDDPVYAVVKQAFATWKPMADLTVDLGQFDTIYGGEVTDSWFNLNYSRGALYYLQPFYHTGLRAAWDYEGYATITALVVNGTNAVAIDNNDTPHVGLQVGVTPMPDLGVSLGYYGGAQSSGYGRLPDGADPDKWSQSNEGWEHVGDLVVNYDMDDLTLVANGTWIRSGQQSDQCVTLNKQKVCGPSTFLGGSLAAGYRIDANFRAALRGEYMKDEHRYISGAYSELTTATATLDYRAVSNLILRLEHRFEMADDDVFAAADNMQDTWHATTLSMVVTTGE